LYSDSLKKYKPLIEMICLQDWSITIWPSYEILEYFGFMKCEICVLTCYKEI